MTTGGQGKGGPAPERELGRGLDRVRPAIIGPAHAPVLAQDPESTGREGPGRDRGKGPAGQALAEPIVTGIDRDPGARVQDPVHGLVLLGRAPIVLAHDPTGLDLDLAPARGHVLVPGSRTET